MAEVGCKCTVTLQYMKDALQWVRAVEKPCFPLCTPANRADAERRPGIKPVCKCGSELVSFLCMGCYSYVLLTKIGPKIAGYRLDHTVAI